MYEIRENTRVVLVTDDIAEVVNHMASEGFEFITDVPAGKAFNNPDGRTAVVRVKAGAAA